MKILIASFGTRGDVQPYLALGRGLQKRGHTVVICAHESFREFVTSYGFEYAYLNNDIVDFLQSDKGRATIDGFDGFLGGVAAIVRASPVIKPMHRRLIRDLWKSVHAASPDLILYHSKAVGIVDMAEKLGVPCMLAFWMPMMVATVEYPAMIFPKWPLGRWYNRLTFRFFEWASWLGTRKYINEWRLENGMLPRSGRRLLEDAKGRPIPAVFAYSQHILPQPRDWPDCALVSGYWFLDAKDDWSPSEELTAFLAAGEPPVYIGFGSIAGSDAKSKARMVLEAVRLAGVRAILASGWGGLDASETELPDDVFVIDAVPHDWLFPRVAAVVHHGGCGTTAAGLRAGRPTVICPFLIDQPYWGKRVAELGVGPTPIHQKKLTAENLSEAIRLATTDRAIRQKAEALGALIRAENGVGKAVEFILRHV